MKKVRLLIFVLFLVIAPNINLAPAQWGEISHNSSNFCLWAEDTSSAGKIREKIEALYSEAVSLRRQLHQFPELCFNEAETAKFIINYLRRWGLEIQTGIGGYGVKAILRGQNSGPVIGIRADMDALPLTEATGLDFSSVNSGVMHACGHDIHITNVLIAARVLAEAKATLPGVVVFIFQPCEEGPADGSPGGADRLLGAGVLENPKIDIMMGLHVMPGYPIGSLAMREGAMMANVSTISIAINGKACHGAAPHEGIDAIYAASLAIIQFQALVSRMKNPAEQAVLSIGQFNAGTRPNIIADKAVLSGTVRTFSPEVELLLENGIENILKGLQSSLGINYEYAFTRSAKYVKNNEKLVSRLMPFFETLLGAGNVITAQPVTIGEDFSVYSHHIPSIFFFLGTGDSAKLHHPAFSPDEKILLTGSLAFVGATLELMKR